MTKYSRKTYLLAHARPLLPDRLMPLIVKAQVGRALKNPGVMARSREHMELLVGVKRPDYDLDDLAAKYVHELRLRVETRWYPKNMRRFDMEGVEHVHATKGGFVFSWLHYGRFDQLGVAARAAGFDTWVMGHPRFFEPNPPPWDRQQFKAADMQTNVFDAREGMEGITSRLDAGLNVSIASDLPGRTEVDFVGRRLLGSFGAARAAHLTGRPVICCTSHRDSQGTPYFRIHEPLDPRSYDDPKDLLQTMLAIQEPAVLEWPESYEEPLGKWGMVPVPAEAPSAQTRG